jgi:hypothetical protein
MTTRIESQSIHTSAHEPPGSYSYVLNINILYSMVSTPRRNILSTPVGGTQPLITFLPIRLSYRSTKHPKKPTLFPTTTYSPPTYLSTPPLPPRHPFTPYPKFPPLPPHHQPAQPSHQHHRHRLQLVLE